MHPDDEDFPIQGFAEFEVPERREADAEGDDLAHKAESDADAALFQVGDGVGGDGGQRPDKKQNGDGLKDQSARFGVAMPGGSRFGM